MRKFISVSAFILFLILFSGGLWYLITHVAREYHPLIAAFIGLGSVLCSITAAALIAFAAIDQHIERQEDRQVLNRVVILAVILISFAASWWLPPQVSEEMIAIMTGIGSLILCIITVGVSLWMYVNIRKGKKPWLKDQHKSP